MKGSGCQVFKVLYPQLEINGCHFRSANYIDIIMIYIFSITLLFIDGYEIKGSFTELVSLPVLPEVSISYPQCLILCQLP